MGNHCIIKNSALLAVDNRRIIYGDIGTSPLYVKAVVGTRSITEDLILAGCPRFSTLTLQTTIKYVLILRADNNGEGGIFSLLHFRWRRRKWLVAPAMLAAHRSLLTVSSHPDFGRIGNYRGLRIIDPALPTVGIAGWQLLPRFHRAAIWYCKDWLMFGPIMVLYGFECSLRWHC